MYLDGRRRYVALGPDEAEAKAAFAQLQADHLAGRLATVGPLAGRVAQVMERCLDAQVRGKKRPATVDHYERAALRAVEWFGADTPVTAIRPIDVDELRAEAIRRRSRSTAGVLMAVVRGALAQAVRDGHLERVPEPPPLPRAKRPTLDRLGARECEEVIAALPDEWRPVGELVLLTGLRRREMLGLDWEDVDLAARIIRVDEEGNVTRYGKGGPKSDCSIRVVPLTARAVEVFSGLRGGTGRVFTATPDQAKTAIRGPWWTPGTSSPGAGGTSCATRTGNFSTPPG